jgi:4-amino-4-deoxy-L-arabinose transferase-like glycosyltransferase
MPQILGTRSPSFSPGSLPDASTTVGNESPLFRKNSYVYLAVLLFASAIYLGCIISPPSLMDDVDAVNGQIARNMLTSGDWVTARLDGVIDLEKPPLIYWLIAGSYKIFGVHDWSARIPVAMFAIGLALLTCAFGIWAFGRKAGFYAGLCMATCVGIFLFTRILISDVMLTFTIALAMWAFLRVIDDEEPHQRRWAFILAAGLGTGLLFKSLIAIVFPVAAGLIYLLLTHELFSREIWKRLRMISGAFIVILIAAPWYVLATLRNPPYFGFTMHGGPGQYHGFFWFFFINEQLLRFLNLRYPRDYNTVPRLYFWLLHFLWLFPWSVYFPAVAKLSFKPIDRAGRTRLLALCWVGFVLVFLTFSTTQEYYSMPCYPALALLLGSAMAMDGPSVRRGTRVLSAISALAALAVICILIYVRHVPVAGDISQALTSHPKVYSLSLGHIEDLTLDSFAYLRTPLLLAGIAFLAGSSGTLRSQGQRAFLAAALMMVIFFHAARLALVVFDPYFSSRPLANALLKSPDGVLIVNHHYFTFSSVFFYTNRSALLLNGRFHNLEYGAYAPGVPDVFIGDADFKNLWIKPERYYLLATDSGVGRMQELVGSSKLALVAESGGKYLFTNHPLASATPP